MKHLEPLIRERLEQERQLGDDWKDKPNDVITWLLEVVKEPHRRTLKNSTIQILLMNFSSIHTTAQAFLNVLFNLAIHPEYVKSMREEVEAVINEEGWTKSAIGKLTKVDSFLRESQRLSGNGLFSVRRKVRRDITFSNETTVPAGGIPHRSVHCDPENHSDPEVFDGFRYAKTRDKEGESTKHGMATLTPEFLTFGHGRHACPGLFSLQARSNRFHVPKKDDRQAASDSSTIIFGPERRARPGRFSAAVEIKMMLAYYAL
ncbi:hypothetical protein AX14_012380 [Amanita brunnescens Koide BX004]|nr:hypothetical protein AX14_012380 [Amanita brunnescens Koide BX004]